MLDSIKNKVTQGSKSFSLTLSNQMVLGLIFTILPIVLGGGYYTVTLYNQMLSTIDKVKVVNTLEDRLISLEERMKSVNERYLELMTQNVKLQDKASEAAALSRETSAVAKGSQREVEATLNAIRNEINAEMDNIKDQMKALKKATTNPLGV